ncbi:MAG: hypothetical protein ACLTSK_03730, partial [Christensenellales bacterium]
DKEPVFVQFSIICALIAAVLLVITHPDDYKRDFIFDTQSEAGNRNLAGYGNTGGRRSENLSD